MLAQPTRARLFAHLARLGHPAGTDELAAELGLHASGVRVHLERLHRAGLIARERVPQPLGRPRDSWSIAPDALPGGQPRDAYPRLAGWLARSIPPRPGRLREVERAGRELGRELQPSRGRAEAEETMGRTLTALGFAPQRQPATTGRVVFRLGNCPYREAVRANQPVVCALHRGTDARPARPARPGGTTGRLRSQGPGSRGMLDRGRGLRAGMNDGGRER